jgi:hypothetical protein
MLDPLIGSALTSGKAQYCQFNCWLIVAGNDNDRWPCGWGLGDQQII